MSENMHCAHTDTHVYTFVVTCTVHVMEYKEMSTSAFSNTSHSTSWQRLLLKDTHTKTAQNRRTTSPKEIEPISQCMSGIVLHAMSRALLHDTAVWQTSYVHQQV
jgi:hypothetical protein